MSVKARLIEYMHQNRLWLAVNSISFALAACLAWRVANAPFSSGWVIAANDTTLTGIVRFSGKTALTLLLFSLACTPIARSLGWNEAIKVRKSLGLWAFGFALFHSLFFLQGKTLFTRQDISFTLWQAIDSMINIVRYGSKVPHTEAGVYALALLLPLALTSNRLAMRYLGKNWKRLHGLVYLAAPVAVWHYWWRQESIFDNTPPDYWQLAIFGLLVGLLLMVRIPPVRRWLTRYLRLEKMQKENNMDYRRQTLLLLIGALLALLVATPALAGGWAVVTVDDLPRSLQAGQPVTLGFMIRQHGRHPVNVEDVSLTARNPTNGEMLQFAAQQQDDEGHYVVEVMLPTPGTWAWAIQPGWFPLMQLAPITVDGTPGPVTTAPQPVFPWMFSGAGLLLLAAAVLTPQPAWRRSRIAGGLAGVILILASIGWAMRSPEAVAAQSAHTGVDAAEIAYGRALFLAKGCNTCHLHAEAVNGWSTEMGPNLTDYAAAPEYLRTWLKDPRSIKPQTEMPNLALKEEEINALMAFLNTPG